MHRIPTSQKNLAAQLETAPVPSAPSVDAGLDDDLIADEPGLSSAMHDIRTLAKSYRREQEPSQLLELGGVSMNASFLLQPRVAQSRESWKGLALTLMVLLGLSTSALALTLYSGLDRNKSENVSEPLELQLETSAIDAPEELRPERVMAAEPPIYRVSTAPGIAVPAPDTRETRAPATSKPQRKQVSSRPERKNFAEVDTCDEVACLIDGSDACCQQYESVRVAQPALSEERSRPYRLTRSEIMQPMQSIRGRVAACADSYGFAGVASVKLVVSPEGAISSVALEDGSSGFQSCVEKHVKTLHFPELLQPFSFAYPYTL